MMQENISKLLRERRGHFEFESGHHGETWLELETLFQDPALVQPIANELASRIAVHSPEVYAAP